MDNIVAANVFKDCFAGYPGFWCVAGGWAIDLFLGEKTREHSDFEVVVLRKDFKILFDQVKKYNPKLILPGGKDEDFPFWDGTEIDESYIQLCLDQQQGLNFDLLLTPSEGNKWICRRKRSLTLPLEKVVASSANDLPILIPEIVLLFKGKYLEEKDQKDFESTLPRLTENSKMWLKNSLELCYGTQHQWIAKL